MQIVTQKELEENERKTKEEERLLKEIEDSFCVAGYEIIDSAIFRECVEVYG